MWKIIMKLETCISKPEVIQKTWNSNCEKVKNYKEITIETRISKPEER